MLVTSFVLSSLSKSSVVCSNLSLLLLLNVFADVHDGSFGEEMSGGTNTRSEVLMAVVQSI